MSQNLIEQDLLAVMSAMDRLAAGEAGSYSDDRAIAQSTGFSLQDVRNFMDILASRNFTIPSNSATEHCAALNAHGRAMLRDSNHNFSSVPTSIIIQGNQGVVLNGSSTLKGVTQTINHSPYLPTNEREQLAALLEELKQHLSQVPDEKAEEAEAVAETAKTLVENANKEKPNESLLGISASGLKEAAKSVGVIAPAVFDTATKIVDLIQGNAS